MAREPQPRRHHHLSRESIAKAALELIDNEGLEAFSLRRLAASLDVTAANLYPYAADRESILRDVLALLLIEIDLTVRPEEPWEDHIVRHFLSRRAMALRHPHAYPLVASAVYDQWPLTDHWRRMERSDRAAGVPEQAVYRLVGMIDAYTIGVLTLLTQVLTRSDRNPDSPFHVGEADVFAYAPENTPQAFEECIRVLITGFKVRHDIPDSTRDVTRTKSRSAVRRATGDAPSGE